MFFIKAAHPGPAYVQIGPSSDPIDERNHMLLSDAQERAYQHALMLVKQGKRDAALDVLRPHFEKAWIEEDDGSF